MLRGVNVVKFRFSSPLQRDFSECAVWWAAERRKCRTEREDSL